MELSSALLLGALQGVTEFFPISSSGHLVIGQHLLGIKEPEVFFDVCLHVGSLIAVLAVFWQDIFDFAAGGIRLPLRLFKRQGTLDSREKAFLLVFVGSIPTALIGFFARHFLESLFASLLAVSINLLITGVVLWCTRYSPSYHPRNIRRTRWGDALWIGLAQGIAIAPGISRSGATISFGLFLGLERDWAVRYSFLLFIPAICGAVALESLHIDRSMVDFTPVAVGIPAATVVGYITLQVLLRTVQRGSIHVFAPYCWLVGCAGLLYNFFV